MSLAFPDEPFEGNSLSASGSATEGEARPHKAVVHWWLHELDFGYVECLEPLQFPAEYASLFDFGA
jgi:hypothetical protein